MSDEEIIKTLRIAAESDTVSHSLPLMILLQIAADRLEALSK